MSQIHSFRVLPTAQLLDSKNASDAQLEVSVYPSAATGLVQIEFLWAIIGQHSAT